METNKYLEYYLDSKIYTNDEVQKSIDETKKEFPNKNIKVNICLNEFGVYLITFEFKNRNTFFNKIKIMFKRKQPNKLMLGEKTININTIKSSKKTRKDRQQKKQEKIQKRFEKYSKVDFYGQYKATGSYRPY